MTLSIIVSVSLLYYTTSKATSHQSVLISSSMATQRQNRREEDSTICSNTVLLVLGLLCVLLGVVLVIVGTVRLHAADKSCSETPSTAKNTASPSSQLCSFSAEAVRVGLPALLEEVKTAYFTHNPNNVAWNPDIRRTEIVEHVKTR